MELGRVTANAAIDGAAMRELRILAGYSIKAFAVKVGCSQPYISLLETRPRMCSPELFARICDALGVADRNVLLRHRNPRCPCTGVRHWAADRNALLRHSTSEAA